MNVVLTFTHKTSLKVWEESGLLSREISFYKKLSEKYGINFTFITYGNEYDLKFNEYFTLLFDCHKDYILQWPFLNSVNQIYEIGKFNIQKYNPGQHFKKIHTERGSLGTLHRVFAFMTYLNDVEEGGSTYFSHYDLEIKPKKGLTLIWPAEWTHAHRGNILEKGKKYIITGWINFAK